jgi:uncharacterized protein YyaL (SSP411 family)
MQRFSPRANRAHLVQWREWGEAAFQEAQEQDKLIVVFLTAFWCGYCQQMDETSLSNKNIHALLNAFFIPIRVEESQRPDVDLRYNQNGWPTIAFLTPLGDPLFSVNYTAPEPFLDLLVKLVDAYQRDQSALLDTGSRNRTEAQARQSREPPARLGPAIVAEIAGMVEGLADATHGGYGTPFKFLHTEANDFLLYLHEVTGDVSHLEHVAFTLQTMRQSRTYDDNDGGFFRYSSKPDWQEPHPEKRLDDQAGLLRNVLRTYLLTGNAAYRGIAEELIDYLNTKLSTSTTPCFFGCQDYVRPALDLAAARRGPQPLISLIDELVYCDANARAASAYLDAWWILGREECKTRALQILERVWKTMRAPDGGMYHFVGGEPLVSGLLMDSVMMGNALLDAYSICGGDEYLARAQHLGEDIARQHRSPDGGFFDISEPGPANLKVPITVFSQNANAALFFVRLADLSGHIAHRKLAHWALKPFPNTHRHHEAFAAGFGQALGRLLALPLRVTLHGTPGDLHLLQLARAALTQLRHGDIVLRFQEDWGCEIPNARLCLGNRQIGPITDPADLSPALATHIDEE